jgi:uncharacterized membrane protein YeiB
MRNREGPASTLGRLDFVDALRGFALFGVFWANLLIFSGIGYMTDERRSALFPGKRDAIAYTLERFLIENKFMGLFSGPAPIVAIAVGGYLVQVLLARMWLRRFRFGPAEWMWRSLTYWKVQPFRAVS